MARGAAGVVTTLGGKPFSVGGFTIRDGKIVEIDFLADPERLVRIDLTLLDGDSGEGPGCARRNTFWLWHLRTRLQARRHLVRVLLHGPEREPG